MLLKFSVVLLFVSLACARRTFVSKNDNPVKWFDTTSENGQGNIVRVSELHAQIHPRHVRSNGRINFPNSGEIQRRWQQIRGDGDEKGHLVASQFSGPAEWYNLSPQNARVNRNKDYQSITTDWYKSECEVREFLNEGGTRHVTWNVKMNYVGNSNRPDSYELRVQYFVNGRQQPTGIFSRIKNPFKREDSTFWICRQCGSNRHDNKPGHDQRPGQDQRPGHNHGPGHDHHSLAIGSQRSRRAQPEERRFGSNDACRRA